MRKSVYTMPFDLCAPKPPTAYSNPLREFYDRFSDNSDSTIRGPFDRYDTNGGSFPVRPSHCNLASSGGPTRNEKTYIGRYLRDNLLATNPATLCAVKNTRILQGLLEHPPLHFVPAKFSRGKCRSTTHFELNSRHERTLCAITDNLKDEHKNLRALDLQKRAQNLQKFVNATRSEATRSETDSVRRIFSTKSQASKVGVQGKRVSDGPRKSKKLLDICQKGNLLKHVRENVEQRILRMDLDDVGAIRYILPQEKDIRFEVDESRGAEQYEFPSHGAMAALCAAKRSENAFYETRSDKELHSMRKSSAERLHKMSMPFPSRGGLPKGLSFSPSLLESVAKVNPPSLMKDGVKVSKSPKLLYSHLGLIEEAKKDICRDLRERLDRREPHLQTPKELSISKYGPLKNVPENPMKGPLLPLHLAVKDFPPTAEELARVELHFRGQKALEKEKRRRKAEEQNSFYAPYTKALLTDSEDEEPCGHELDDISVNPERLEDFQNTKMLVSGVSLKDTLMMIPQRGFRCSPPTLSSAAEASFEMYKKPTPRKLSSETRVSSRLSKSEVKLKSSLKKSVGLRKSEIDGVITSGESSLEEEPEEDVAVAKNEIISLHSKLKLSGESSVEDLDTLQQLPRYSSDNHVDELNLKLSQLSLEKFAERRVSEVDKVIVSAERTLEEADDVDFSDVAVPKIDGIHDLVFYKSLARDDQSSSGNSDNLSEESEDEEESEEEEKNEHDYVPPAHSEFSIIALLEKDSEHEEEEEEVESSTTFTTEQDDEVTRRMRELLGDNLDLDFVFRTDPRWKQLVTVERVPVQVHLKDPHIARKKEADLPPHLQQALYDYKQMREEARLQLRAEEEEVRRQDVSHFRTSVFGLYAQKKQAKTYRRLLKNPEFPVKAMSIYELSPVEAHAKRKATLLADS